MKRVGFFSESLHSGGGLELCEYDIAKRLFNRSWDVRVAYQNDGDLVSKWEEFARLEKYSFTEDDINTRISTFLEGCDVLYVHRPGDFNQSFCISKMINIPIVMHLHLPPTHVRHGWKKFVLGTYRKSTDPEIFSRHSKVDKFLSVSDFNASSWIDSGIPEHKIEVVHNGVDTLTYVPCSPSDKKSIRQELCIQTNAIAIGYVGRIDTTKGIHQLLEAFKWVSSRTTHPLTLLVIGEPTKALKAKGTQLLYELKQNSVGDVRWLGKRRDLPKLYQAMDILVVPSQWEEPFGLVVVEGLASQLPVIATRTGGMQEVLSGSIDDNLVGRSSRNIAVRLLELVESKSLRESIAKRGRNLAKEKYDVEKTVDRIEKSLLSTISSRSS